MSFAGHEWDRMKRDVRERNSHLWTLLIFAAIGFGMLILFVYLTH